MHFRKLRTSVALLAATVGVSAFAASANAAAIDNDAFALTADTNGEVSLTGANMAWDWTGGVTTPHLTGKLQIVNGDDACYRATINSYDYAGKLLHTTPGGSECPTDDLSHSWTVDLSAPADALTHSARVSVEKETITQPWMLRDSLTVMPSVSPDSFQILGAGIDVGGSGWNGTDPTGNAVVSWQIDNSGKMVGSYSGYLHFNGFSKCGRVSLRYLDDTNHVIQTVNGPKHCPADLSHYSYLDSLANTASASVSKVKVRMQSKTGGTWTDVSAKTLSIG